ncbi:hypothetical protein PHO31112_03458 [Pandoraea horticolens]|uniref:Uncharacterized protein n=1 Tax=Pandoraea horticolens TaxID=2508298 RepID=A0A5E4WWV7_9BURK|nr:hypothetical protein PHO31112_03458 [Pandoraea horticolens]
MRANFRVPDRQLFSEYYGVPPPVGEWLDEVIRISLTTGSALDRWARPFF